MAIKPNDCILQLDKIMEPGTCVDWDGTEFTIYVYPKFWDNFIKSSVGVIDKNFYGIQRRQLYASRNNKLINDGLAKFGGEYKKKDTKEWVKFNSSEDLLYFKLMWI